MAITKREITLTLAATVVAMLLLVTGIGMSTAFIYGDIKMTQDQYDSAWQFTILFAGAALMYFGFRAGQSNGTATSQS